jgi:hypothetical protein
MNLDGLQPKFFCRCPRGFVPEKRLDFEFPKKFASFNTQLRPIR